MPTPRGFSGVGKDADDVGASPDLADRTLERVGRVDLWAVGPWGNS
jgi:hypothetical protein